jgi:hypothetical protein
MGFGRNDKQSLYPGEACTGNMPLKATHDIPTHN